MNKPPDKIYLQWAYGINRPNFEVTWCVDQVAEGEDVDVEYVRADLFTDTQIEVALELSLLVDTIENE